MENQNKSCLEKDTTSAAKLDVETGDLRQRDETKPFYANSLTPREMESLVAICDTFISSIDGSGVGHVGDCVAGYFSASASQTGTPDRVSVVYTIMHSHIKEIYIHTTIILIYTHMHAHISYNIYKTYICFPIYICYMVLSKSIQKN